MNIQNFTYLLKHPQEISRKQTEELEKVITAFPYFQSARLLYLKGLKKQDSYKYNQTLKTTAAYTTDRSILFNFITSSSFIDKNNNGNTDEIEVADVETVKTSLKKIKKSTTPTKVEKAIEILEIGKPLAFKNDESHSFNEWLQLGIFKPIERKKTKSKHAEKFDIIDKFIATNPKIKPIRKSDSSPTLEKQESTDYKNLMTETLAQVYLEQKKYEYAIKAYRILSLKYPEKSSFFADQINEIKILENK